MVQVTRRPPMARGKDLIEKWDLAVQRAQFHRDGTWFNLPVGYPVALCDPNGYVVFDDREHIEATYGVHAGNKRVNISDGISSLREYHLVDNPVTEKPPKFQP